MSSPTGKRHSVVCSNLDYDFFYNGLEDGLLLIQQCVGCGVLRNPPSPMCPACISTQWQGVQMSGLGTVYSYTIHHRPPLPNFSSPHPVGLIDLDEGVRFVAALDGMSESDLQIGMPVVAEFIRRGNVPSIRFRAA